MTTFFKISGILFLILFSFSSCLEAQEDSSQTVQPKIPKNIILLIGDGTGLSQISSTLFYNKEKSNYERFSSIGLIKTSSSSDLITDSAAGATAFASGIKTYNGAIGMKPDSTAIATIVEQISIKNIGTGLVATSSIVHATPAAFYAHSKSRRNYEEIANYLVDSEIDFFAAGGTKFFNKRKDGRNLLKNLKKNGFEVETKKLPSKISEKKQAILLAEDGMPKMLEGRGDFLPNATKLALDKLATFKEGFFLMVEGSQIDWGGHANDADYLISELIDFDKTIGVALDFAAKNKETLVIVLADHETGGFTLASDAGDYNKIAPSFSTGGHSATMIPVFAKGPGEHLFQGIYENTAIYHKIKSLFFN
ncbi:MAG: alkaline phosphatase [Flavobacteriales bacterium]